MKEAIINFLLENADPSIVLRVKKEILSFCSPSDEKELLDRILLQKNVQTVLQSQKEDGWFGNNFHGQSAKNGAGMYDNMEVGLRYLVEKGLPWNNNYIRKAVNSILTKEYYDKAFGMKPVNPPDTDYSYTAIGLYLLRSSILIRAGYEGLLTDNHTIDLKHDIDYSLSCFFNVLNYDDINDVLDRQRRQVAFHPSAKWPCMYDLRILAHSRSWRTKDNEEMLARSVEHLLHFDNVQDMIYTYRKGQFVGPAFAFIGQQMCILGLSNPKEVSLDAMELLARCGLVTKVDKIKEKYDYLISMVNPDLTLNFQIDKRKDFRWGPYHGFALSESWRKDINVQSDILFRILLIQHCTEQ